MGLHYRTAGNLPYTVSSFRIPGPATISLTKFVDMLRQTAAKVRSLVPVSYTHLTLPTT